MQEDIKAIYNRTQSIDSKLSELSTSSTVVSEDALAYKAELMRKKREREGHADDVDVPAASTINTEKTSTEEDN